MGHKYILKKEELQTTVEDLRTKVADLEEVVSTVTFKKTRRKRTAISTPLVETEAVTMELEELITD